MPTLQIIADRAGVSRETVSHILGGKLAGRYRASTRERVLEIAKTLNYMPHRGAQVMKSGRSNLIAIVHFGAGIEVVHKINHALSRFVSAHGYDYLAMDMNWYGGSVERTLTELIRARVEGVLISHIQAGFEDEHIAQLRNAGIPVVSVNGGRRENVSLVYSNAGKAFFEITQYLFEVGHRNVLHLNSSFSNISSLDKLPVSTHRVMGFKNAVESKGEYLSVEEEEFFLLWPKILKTQPPGGILGINVKQNPELYAQVNKPVYRFCKKLFRKKKLPDAIVCLNDLYAMEVIAAALECKIRIPEDLAVTGYDNDRIGEFPAFGITTAEQDVERISSDAVDILMEQIAHPNTPVKDRMVNSKVIIRSSSGTRSQG